MIVDAAPIPGVDRPAAVPPCPAGHPLPPSHLSGSAGGELSATEFPSSVGGSDPVERPPARRPLPGRTLVAAVIAAAVLLGCGPGEAESCRGKGGTYVADSPVLVMQPIYNAATKTTTFVQQWIPQGHCEMPG
jgi:hypothetical protein